MEFVVVLVLLALALVFGEGTHLAAGVKGVFSKLAGSLDTTHQQKTQTAVAHH
jgi:Flp pilus assembly pilin Flp